MRFPGNPLNYNIPPLILQTSHSHPLSPLHIYHDSRGWKRDKDTQSNSHSESQWWKWRRRGKHSSEDTDEERSFCVLLRHITREKNGWKWIKESGKAITRGKISTTSHSRTLSIRQWPYIKCSRSMGESEENYFAKVLQLFFFSILSLLREKNF